MALTLALTLMQYVSRKARREGGYSFLSSAYGN
jgi:hypothetical protein